VEADGHGGYGGVTTVTVPDATVELSLYPREQYFGENVQVRVEVTTKERRRSTSTRPPANTIRATVTIIPCISIPGPPGSPAGAPSPFASDRRTLDAVSIGLNQRPDRPPPPVGPPPGR